MFLFFAMIIVLPLIMAKNRNIEEIYNHLSDLDRMRTLASNKQERERIEDVYKRQPMMWFLDQGQPKLDEIEITERCVANEAVSYTHLDVYKRQMITLSCWSWDAARVNIPWNLPSSILR